MNQEKFRVSGRLFKSILTQMDSLSREDLVILQTEGADLNPELCSPAFYHVMQALGDLARVELVNRDLAQTFKEVHSGGFTVGKTII